MKLSPQLKIALIIAAVSFFVVGLAVLALLPQYNKFQQYNFEKEQYQSNLLSARTVLASRTQLKQNYASLQNDVIQQKSAVPDNARLTSVIRQIQNMAYENNHWMTSIKNTDPISTEGVLYNSWDCEIVLEGNWLDTLSFLRDLRDMKRQVRVNKVDFQRITDIRNGEPLAKRVVKHWDPEAYPVRTTVTATLYYIPKDNVGKPIKKVLNAVGATSQPAANNTQTTQTQGGAK